MTEEKETADVEAEVTAVEEEQEERAEGYAMAEGLDPLTVGSLQKGGDLELLGMWTAEGSEVIAACLVNPLPVRGKHLVVMPESTLSMAPFSPLLVQL